MTTQNTDILINALKYIASASCVYSYHQLAALSRCALKDYADATAMDSETNGAIEAVRRHATLEASDSPPSSIHSYNRPPLRTADGDTPVHLGSTITYKDIVWVVNDYNRYANTVTLAREDGPEDVVTAKAIGMVWQ